MQRLHTNESSLNLFKLKRLIDSGVTSIPADRKHKSAILVIGDTGVGKTTILSFLAKRKLFIKTYGLNTVLDSEDKEGLKIGHERFSETRVPQKIIIDNMVFFDCSGFKDNRGQEYEISNSFFVKRLFDIYPNIKILLMVDESSISESRADKLPKLVRNLLNSFDNLEDIQSGVMLLINKAKPQFSEKTYSDQLLKMAKLKGQEGSLFSEEESKFIEYLVHNKKVCLFKQAQKEDEGKPLNVKEENLMNLIKDTHFVKGKKIKNIISESAKLSIRDFMDRLSQDAEEKVHAFTQSIVKDANFKSKSSFSNNLQAAENAKQKLANFLTAMQKSSDENLVEVVRENAEADISSFEQDVSAVLFFKEIYNKADFYFKIVRADLTNQLTKVILQIQQEIVTLREQERKFKEMEKAVEDKENEIKKLRSELSEAQIHHEAFSEEAANLTKNYNQSLNELHSELDNKSGKVRELEALIESLSLESKEQVEQIDLLNIENVSLKHELDKLGEELSRKQEVSQANSSMLSISSKTSKYPDVVCPHFKNGGKCVHCIKAWKAEQKKKKEEASH